MRKEVFRISYSGKVLPFKKLGFSKLKQLSHTQKIDHMKWVVIAVHRWNTYPCHLFFLRAHSEKVKKYYFIIASDRNICHPHTIDSNTQVDKTIVTLDYCLLSWFKPLRGPPPLMSRPQWLKKAIMLLCSILEKVSLFRVEMMKDNSLVHARCHDKIQFICKKGSTSIILL